VQRYPEPSARAIIGFEPEEILMAVNLLELVQNQLSGPIVQKISGLVGESESATKSALGVAVPSLLAGAMRQSSTPTGANALAATLDHVDTGILGNLGSALSSGGGRLMEMGSRLLKNLFGGSLDTVTDGIARASGMSRSGIGSLLAMITPVVFGVLGRQKAAMGLDAGGLANLLSGQKSFLSGLLPSGLAESLGLGSRAAARDAGRDTVRSGVDTGRQAVASAGRVGAATVREGSSVVGKVLPIALDRVARFHRVARVQPEVQADRRAGGDVAGRHDAPAGRDGVREHDRRALRRPRRGQRESRAAQARGERSHREHAREPGRLDDGGGPRADREDRRQPAPALESAADRALAIPGVGDVLQPAVTQLLDGLGKLRP
jgi:hypothetical protein